MTQKEFAELGQAEFVKMADEIAQNITLRTYVDGCSRDTTRKSTKKEKEIIFKLAYASFLAYGWRSNGGSLDSILDTAEFAMHQFLPEANAYDTLYIPVKKAVGVW